MAIRAVLFDAGGVLYGRHESPTALLERFVAENGRPELSENGRARERALRLEATLGRLAPAAHWDACLRLHGIEAEDERRLLVSHLEAQSDDVFEMPGAAATVAELKRRGFRIGVVTDTIHPIERKRAWLRRVGVADLLDALACSTALGVRKPDPRIYLAALEQLGVPPSAALFVGRETGELADARALGLTTAAVHHAPDAVADHRLGSLADLLSLPILARPPAP